MLGEIPVGEKRKRVIVLRARGYLLGCRQIFRITVRIKDEHFPFCDVSRRDRTNRMLANGSLRITISHHADKLAK
jgi:hypothetical protein